MYTYFLAGISPTTSNFRPCPQVSVYYWLRNLSFRMRLPSTQNNNNNNNNNNQAQFFTVDTVFKMATLFSGFLKVEQDANFARFTTHAMLPIFPGEPWVLEWIRRTWRENKIWIRILVDVEIFESGKLKLWIEKYPDTCERGLYSFMFLNRISTRVVCVNAFSFPELRSFWSASGVPDADQKDRSSGNENVVSGKHHLSAMDKECLSRHKMCLDF